MKPKDIAELLNEPSCEHNKKSKSGCARPKPGSTAGGCAFDGAQIALIPIADVAHIVHGPDRLRGQLVGQPRDPLVRPRAVPDRDDDRPDRAGRDHGPGREAPLPRDQAGDRRPPPGGRLRLQHVRPRPDRRRHRGGLQGRAGADGRVGRADRLRRVLRHQEPGQPDRRRRDGQVRDRHPRARPAPRPSQADGTSAFTT